MLVDGMRRAENLPQWGPFISNSSAATLLYDRIVIQKSDGQFPARVIEMTSDNNPERAARASSPIFF